jgi:N-acetyl-gamma-glutamyl-phosphate reductase
MAREPPLVAFDALRRRGQRLAARAPWRCPAASRPPPSSRCGRSRQRRAPVLFARPASSGGGTASQVIPARASNLWAYAPFAHRHEAEIAERWREWAGPGAPPPRLLVHAGPFVRGIHLTLHARLPDAAGAAAAYEEAYADRPFVRVLDAPPELAHVVGTNEARLHALAHPDGGELHVTIAIDNLLKGAAGQAVQAMNLALGLPETAGLVLAGTYPC